nr:caspase family protein [Pseudenhygromyxa sp. WMMC2535]
MTVLVGLVGLVVVALIGLGAGPARAGEPTKVRRVALLVSANDGGGERDRLLYAASDAQSLAKVLGDLGGLRSSDRLVLEEPGPADLERAFAEVAKIVRQASAAGERVQFVFYYSGHSDETGLLLGGVHLDYKSLRAAIDRVPADVRIAILDSCSSGAFTRQKGGRKQAPFLAGSAAEVRGHAFLTSSSADEAAQESDRVGGSFFTHFFVTGLRGAADADGDRLVTLDEAYRFAFDETLASTQASLGGPQHAAYDIHLAGTGDLVMTDLRKTSASLALAAGLSGRVYVRDRRGQLAAELLKPKGTAAVSLALEPGNYTVTIDDGRALHRAEVAVRSGKTATLELEGLEDIPLESTRLRGGPPKDEPRGLAMPSPPPGGYTRVPFNIGVTPGAELNAGARGPVLNNLSFGVLATSAAAVDGIQAGVAAAWTRDRVRGIQAAAGFVSSRGPVYGLQTSVGLALAQAGLQGIQFGVVAVALEGFGGVQAGVVSVADAGRGVQFGVINVTKGELAGLQFGLINVADEADVSIGLIPYTRQGGVWFDLWTSDVQLLNLALRFRARRSYTFLTAGIHPFGGDDSASWSAGMGLGGPLVWRRRFSLELDNAVSMVSAGFGSTDSRPYLWDTLRLSVAYRPARHFSLWGGVTANMLIDPVGREAGFRPGYGWSQALLDESQAGAQIRIWPGFTAGFEF